MKLISIVMATLLMVNSVISPVLAAESSNKLSVPEIHGESALLMDVKTGQILYSKNPDEQLQPASTTKIMTGLLAIEKGNLDDIVTASPTVLDRDIVYGTLIYLGPGEQMRLRDLLFALLLNSANDAAVDIAEHVSGSIEAFAKLMNDRAKEIGAVNTTFKNPNGLTEEGHVTTARDLALIARTAYQNPLFRQYVGTKMHVIPRAKEGIPSQMSNENRLLWRDSTVTGIKSGYTAAAQNTLVASASREGRDLIGVILKSPGREIYDDMEDLLDYGFANFENRVYKPQGAVLSSLVINETSVNLVLDEPIDYTQALGSDLPPDIHLKVLPSSSEVTEIEKGQIVTKVQVVTGKGRVLNEFPLKADTTVKPIPPKKMGSGWIVIPLALFLIYNVYYHYKRAASRKRRQKRLSRRKYMERSMSK